MTNRSDIRRLLWRWGRVAESCKAKQRELEEFQNILKSCTDLSASVIDGMPHGTNTTDPTQRAAIKLAGIAEEYEQIIEIIRREISEELRFKYSMDKAVSELPAEQQRIIELRYKRGHRWTYISLKLCFSEHHVQKLENKAVNVIAGKVKMECF